MPNLKNCFRKHIKLTLLVKENLVNQGSKFVEKKELNNMILTLTGASGAGKTTICRELLKKLPIYARVVPSYTTRNSKENDIQGEYKHISKLRFWFLKKIGAFCWTAYPHGNSYGTTKCWVIKALRDDDVAYIMILTPDAVVKLKDFSEEAGCSNRIYPFYVISPSQKILRERLKSRGDKEDEVEKRIKDCIKWDSEAKMSGIPYQFITNNSIVESVTEEVIKLFLQKFGGCDSCF